MMTKTLATVVLLTAAQDTERRKAEAKLRGVKVSLSYEAAPLRDVVDYLRDLTDLNILLDAESGAKATSPVTVALKEVSAASALRLILEPRGLVLTWRDGVFLIVSRAKAERRIRLEIYDVRELMFPIRDFPGVDLQLSSSGIGASVAIEEPPEPTEFPLEEIVRAHTGGKSWEENAETRVALSNGLLIVRQTREVHARIRRLLALLRRSK